jgi:hypothetical protein
MSPASSSPSGVVLRTPAESQRRIRDAVFASHLLAPADAGAAAESFDPGPVVAQAAASTLSINPRNAWVPLIDGLPASSHRCAC